MRIDRKMFISNLALGGAGILTGRTLYRAAIGKSVGNQCSYNEALETAI